MMTTTKKTKTTTPTTTTATNERTYGISEMTSQTMLESQNNAAQNIPKLISIAAAAVEAATVSSSAAEDKRIIICVKTI